MTKEEKQLLLKDLCARLPYGVKFNFGNYDGCDYKVEIISPVAINNSFPIEDCKPYLRPMSSMTEKEKFEIWDKFYETDGRGFPDGIKESMAFDYVDWLNVHHFDFRGLIEKWLALEAPEGMYE